jgi:hypothetical protein
MKSVVLVAELKNLIGRLQYASSLERVTCLTEMYNLINSSAGRKLLREQPVFASALKEQATVFRPKLSSFLWYGDHSEPFLEGSKAYLALNAMELNCWGILRRRYNFRTRVKKPIRYRS